MALLSHLTVKVSGIINAPVDEVWKIVRLFGAVGQWLHPVEGLTDVKSHLLPGTVEGQVGGMRVVSMGLNSYVEQLECLDEEARQLKWRLVSHPLNTNPFPAKMLNLKSCLQVLDVTREQATFMSWTVDFDTDYEGQDVMRSEIGTRLETGFEGLSALLAPKLPQFLGHGMGREPGSGATSTAGSTAPVEGASHPKLGVARHSASSQGIAGEMSEDPVVQNDRLWQHQQMMAGRNPFQTAAAGLPADAVPQPGGSTFTFPGLPFSGAQPALQQVASDPSLPSRPQDQHVGQPAIDTAPAAAMRDSHAGRPVGDVAGYPPNVTQLSPEHLEYIMAMSQQVDPRRGMTEEARWPEAPRSTLHDSMQSSQLGPSRTGSFHSEGPTASPKAGMQRE